MLYETQYSNIELSLVDKLLSKVMLSYLAQWQRRQIQAPLSQSSVHHNRCMNNTTRQEICHQCTDQGSNDFISLFHFIGIAVWAHSLASHTRHNIYVTAIVL